MKKRICAVILSLLLAVNLAGVPKAKAVVSETALLGSIFGSLLVSLGYSWAADNMDVPTFGESIYKLIQEHDEANKDTGLQLIRDLSIASLTSGRPGTIQFNYAWTQAARSFAEWFEGKFFSGSNTIAVVNDGSLSFVGASGTLFNLIGNVSGVNASPYYVFPSVNPSATILYDLSVGGLVVWDYSPDFKLEFNIDSSNTFSVRRYNKSSATYTKLQSYTVNSNSKGFYAFCVLNGKLNVAESSDGNTWMCYGGNSTWVNTSAESLSMSPSLTAEKPAEVHYPDVAEDGSQVYEITVDGVTATDIEGIIQGAVDRILAGTAAIAGEVTQAQDVPVEPEAPAAGEYAVPGLETIFPFCIPFDIYAFCAALNADPVAPSFEWRMQYAPLDLDYTFVIDLEAFDGAARVLRTMELLAFCVGLAFWTRHLIRG